MLHVMRAREGDRVTLFDGAGTEMSARVERCGRSEVVLAVLDRLPGNAKHQPISIIAVAHRACSTRCPSSAFLNQYLILVRIVVVPVFTGSGMV